MSSLRVRLLLTPLSLLLLLLACSSQEERLPPEYAPERPYVGMAVSLGPLLGEEVVWVENNIDPQGPAAIAGVGEGMLVRSFDGRQVETSEEMMSLVEARQPGDTLELVIERGRPWFGRTPEWEVVTVIVALAEERLPPGSGAWLPHTALRWEDQLRLGMYLADISPRLGAHYGLDSPEGVLVLHPPNAHSTAFEAGVQEGDVLVSIMGKRVDYLREVGDVLRGVREDRPISIVVRREGVEHELTLPPLGPDLPGANALPLAARQRLHAALERGAIHPERLSAIAENFRTDYPEPGQGGLRFGEITALTEDSITLQLFSTGEEWAVALSPRTRMAPGDYPLADLRPGDFVAVARSPDGTAVFIYVMSLP